MSVTVRTGPGPAVRTWTRYSLPRRIGASGRAAGAMVLALALLLAAAAAASAASLISNGGFEAGLAGWTAGTRPAAADGGAPALFAPLGWTAAGAPQSAGSLSLAPISGTTAFSSFDGGPAGLQLFLSQPFDLNETAHDATLTFTYDIVGPGGTGQPDPAAPTRLLQRSFDVLITDLLGHERARLFHYGVPVTGDLNPRQTVSLDIRSALNTLGRGGYRLEFRLTAPEANAGPALFSLDDVSLDLTANRSPSADCPASVQVGSVGAKTPVTLAGSGSDPEGDSLSFEWLQGGTLLSTNPVLNVDLALGHYVFTFVVTDLFGASSACDVAVDVVSTKPVITCPADVTVTGAPAGGLAVNYPAPAVTGGIGAVTVVSNPASGSTFPVGTTTVNATATDSAGNVSACSFKVTVVRADPLTITCPANITKSTDAGKCTAVVSYPAPATAGGVGAVTVTTTPASGSTFPKGATTVTATATDAAGNQQRCSFTVTVNDTEKPVLTCPADITVTGAPASGSVVTYTTPAATDNCPGVTVVSTPASGGTFPVGTTTVTATATDASGNTATCSFKVTVVAAGALAVTCPANVTTSTDPGKCTAVVSYPAPVVSGGIGSSTVVTTPASGSTFAKGTTTVTATATDSAGSTSTCSFTVTVNDTEKPALTCPADVTVTGVPAGGTTVTYPAPAATDNCPGVTVVSTPASGSLFPVGTTTVNCTATDSSGNTSTCSFKVTVAAAGALAVTCPANVTVPAEAGKCTAVVTYPAPTASGGVGAVTVVSTPASGSTFAQGATTVTVTATDSAGSHATCTFTVTVNDTEKPVITCPANITAATDPGKCTAAVNYPAPTATDNCGAVTVVSTPASGSTFPKGTTTVTATATDGAGNTSTCTFTVTVNDTEKPIITCPANVTVGADPGKCTAAVTYAAPAATDNCPGVTVVSTPASGSTFAKGTTTVTATATDASGNTSTCSFTVTVNDTEKPVITCPADVTVTGAPASGTTVTYPPPTATDNCSGATVVATPASGSLFPVGTTTVTCTATDGAGNTSTCSFKVTVAAAGALAITCPANVSAVADPGKCTAVVNYPAPTTSGGVGTVTVVSNPPSGSTFPKGATTVTATATDGAGSQATCTFTVTVSDTEKPAITCPGNVTVSTDPGKCTAVVNYSAPTATDNCGTITVVSSPAPGSTFPKGTTTVTATATDGDGNSATCSFTVTVNDTEKPQIACPADVTVTGAPAGGTTVTYPAATATDNCGAVTVVSTPASGASFPVGTTTVTATATDGAGNTSTCTFKVTVAAAAPLSITCPASVTAGTDAGKCTAVVNYPAPTTTGGSGTVTVVSNPPSGSTFPKGATTVTSTATDGAGNMSSCTFTVTVNDTEKPAVACPGNITASTDAGKCTAVVNYPAPTATDNCGAVTVVASPASGSTFPKGTTTVTATATDGAGNTSTCTFTVTVNDTEKPLVTCPANITVTGAPPGGQAVTFTCPTATDNCGVASVVCTPLSGSTFPVGTTTVTVTATDTSGNQQSCTFTVTVDQGLAITCPGNITQGTDPGKCTAAVTYPAAVTSGGVGAVTVSFNPPSGSTFAKGPATTVTATATDSAGNHTSCTFTVKVNDTEAPVVAAFPNLTQTVDINSCKVWTPTDDEVATLFGATATDNCDSALTAAFVSRSDGKALGAPFPTGTTMIVWGATDAAGNTGTRSQSVTVLAPSAWSLSVPSTYTIWVGPGVTSAPLSLPAAINGAHCDVQISTSPARGTTLALNTPTPVTVTAMDANGVTHTATSTVTVKEDNIAPTFTNCPGHITVQAQFTGGSAFVDYGVTATDNSGFVTLTSTPEFGHLFPLGDTTVTCTATDRFGNTSTCTFTVTVTP